MNGEGMRCVGMSHLGLKEKECLGEPGNVVKVAIKSYRNGSCRDARSMRRHAPTTFVEAVGRLCSELVSSKCKARGRSRCKRDR